jgi:hypothetical protein
MVRAMIKKAVAGDAAAFQVIADRSDGKPKVVFAGDEEEPIAISVTRGDDARSRIEAALNQLATRQAVIEAVADEGSEQP